MTVKKFSDFAEGGGPLGGDKVKIEAILNQEILVTGYKIKTSKYVKEGVEHCLTVQFEIDGHKRIFFTGSNVLKDQLEKYACEIPFLATLKKIDRYFTFS